MFEDVYSELWRLDSILCSVIKLFKLIISISYSTSILPNESSVSEIPSDDFSWKDILLHSSNFLVGLTKLLFRFPNDITMGMLLNFRGCDAPDNKFFDDNFLSCFSSFSEICSRLKEFFTFSLHGEMIEVLEMGVDPDRISLKDCLVCMVGFGEISF